ncbi:MAG: ABC transporter substrate-binding protein [Eubacteriales bacterium]|nr:ABC transporter substrate-binding protein [Eubacteriales bacterium]
MKKFSKVLALALALTMLAGMVGFASAETAAYSEAPILTEKVTASELPAVADRLPTDVMVETGIEVGQYCDSIVFTQTSSKWWPEKITEEPLFRFKQDGSAEIEPNVAKGYDVNEDATVWTIYLREGMKWSDGVDFTSEDCRYFYEDLLIPGVTTNSVWDAMYSTDPESGEKDAEPAKMAIVDDYTFTITFQHSKPSFLQELAINGKWFFAPKHWLQDYLAIGIGEEAATAKATELGYADLNAYNKDLTYYTWLIVGRPSLRPWVIQNDFNDQLITWARNPYFWKVDENGQQLPYADKLEFMRFSEDTQALLWTLDGTLDVNVVNIVNIVELQENAEKGGYDLKEWGETKWAGHAIQLNQAILDEDMRALFQNVDFRQALSVAINRQQICDIIDDGFSVPRQSSPSEGTPGANEEWANKWTEYDPAKAEELLAACGLTKGADGYYCFDNGKQVVLNLQYNDNEGDKAPLAELLVNDFEAVGLKTTSRLYDRSILEEMRSANTHEITIDWEMFDAVSVALRPDYIVPTRDYPPWATAFGLWYMTDGKDGVEPSQAVKDMLTVFDQLKASTDNAKREELSLEILKMHQDNIWEIGLTSRVPRLNAVNSKLHNFPDYLINADEFRELGLAHPYTWWIEQ